MLSRSGCDNSIEDMKGEPDVKFLKYMDALGPQSFSLAVRDKEAIRDRRRLNLFETHWAQEDSTRLDKIRQLILQEAEEDLVEAERESAALLSRLLEMNPSLTTAMDPQYLAILRDRCRRSLRATDTRLDIFKLQDHIIRKKMTSSFGDSDNPATVKDFLADDNCKCGRSHSSIRT
ncbi:hypothetical protein EDD22DRAFT_451656 [Suillus occidentalis]|nr:hypothetical protein EDD22DRAFT_451656 [Suillus occidentalis]